VIKHLKECLEAEEKVVVFAHHHDLVHALQREFPTAAVVTGETPVGSRSLEVDKFQFDPNCHLFIGSIHAAGVGLTLTAAQLVVFAELDWVPGNVSQAEDRLHRIGQRGSVLVQHLVFDDSVDSIMVHTIIEKQEVIEKALDRRTETVQAIEQPQSPLIEYAGFQYAMRDGRAVPLPGQHHAASKERHRQAAAQQAVQSEIPVDEEIPF
jgi:SNF2 family DNA or RNA helicase